MARFFTHYWTNETLHDNRINEGQPLLHTAGNQFRSKKIKSGDVIYVVSVVEGFLYVIGKMEVDLLCDFYEACEVLETSEIYYARDHLIAKSGSESSQRFDRSFEPKELKRFEFINSEGLQTPPKFLSDGKLDRQTFRGTREITQTSAQLLEKRIDLKNITAQDIDQPDKYEEGYEEGSEHFKLHKVRERNPSLVRHVKEERKKKDPYLCCDVCGFSFALTYGNIGSGFIEAHHIIPLFKMDGLTETFPDDIAIVCSNCHRMLHKSGKTIKQLSDIIKRN